MNADVEYYSVCLCAGSYKRRSRFALTEAERAGELRVGELRVGELRAGELRVGELRNLASLSFSRAVLIMRHRD